LKWVVSSGRVWTWPVLSTGQLKNTQVNIVKCGGSILRWLQWWLRVLAVAVSAAAVFSWVGG